MVLENSQDLQTTSTSLLDVSPEGLEATLHGPAGRTSSSSSDVALLLAKLHEQKDASNTFSLGNNIHNNGQFNSLLHNSCVKETNNSSDFSHLLIKDSEALGGMKFFISEPWENSDNTSIIIGNQHGTKLGSLDDADLDSFTSSGSSRHVKPFSGSLADSNYPLSLKRTCSTSSFTSSSDDGCLYEDNILTDSKCGKKIEQALKLGYSEQNVMGALTRLGPECAINDLLSELIKLETSDSELISCQSLPSEADLNLQNDVRARSDYMSLMSVDSSGCSSSADMVRDSLDIASLGSSFQDADGSSNLCDIIVDGSNVAMSHGKTVFSCKGIQLAVDWFLARGHKNITVFVPQWRKESSQPSSPITDQDILYDLEKEGIIVFTPSRRVKGRRVICYDDRYVLNLALETDGIVVSNDVYRDLVKEKEEFRKVVDQKLLMYSFVNDRFMPPEDPLGRLGPTLDDFLRKTPLEPNPKPQDCPYGKKCTYGNKCRFYHPKGGFSHQNSVAETLKEQTNLKLLERGSKMSETAEKGKRPKQKLTRTKSLAPLECLLSSISTSNQLKSKNGKPKLGHSSSLVMPTKSSDYLNEPRKKLEEAELAAALEKLSARDATFVQKLPEVYLPGHSDRKTNSKASSRRSSPAFTKDAFKDITATDSQPEHIFPLKSLNTHTPHASTSPLKSLNTNSPRGSPSLLALPKAESPDGYLSGHLYLAKKLSDESTECSFFSEHTSSNSSTRTSSPSSKISEPKQFSRVDTYLKNRPDYNTRCCDLSAQLHPFLQQQQYHMTSDPQIFQQPNLPSIPSLSVYEDGMSMYSQNFDSGIIPSHRHNNGDTAQFIDCFIQNTDPRSPDSGVECAWTPYPNQLEHQLLRGHSLSSPEESLLSQKCPCLHQSDIMTSNVKPVENSLQKFGSRFSGSPSLSFGEEYSSMPAQVKANTYQFGTPQSLNKQHSGFDIQSHNLFGTGKCQDMMSSISDTSARNSDTYFSHSQQHPLHFQQQHCYGSPPPGLLDHHDTLERQQHQQHSDPSLLFSHLLSKPMTDPWGQPDSQVSRDHTSSLDDTIHGQYQPHQNAVSYQIPNHLPQFQSSTSSQNMTPGIHSHTSLYLQPPPQFPPPPVLHTPFYAYPPPSMQSLPTRHGFSTSPNYPQLNYTPQNNIQSYQPPLKSATLREDSPIPLQSLPTSHGFSSSLNYPQLNYTPQTNIQSYQPPMKSSILSEDSPIRPDDPSYPVYYHLSSVFGEKMVRTVLNRNPGVVSPDQLCKLIMKYKEEVGGS